MTITIITQRVINDGGIPRMIHDRDRGGESVHDDHLDFAMNFRGSRGDDLHGGDSHDGDRGLPDDDHGVEHRHDVARDHAAGMSGDALGERNHDCRSGFCQTCGLAHVQWRDGVGYHLHGGQGLLVCCRQKKQERKRGNTSKTWRI